jgi:hypothetical protein
VRWSWRRSIEEMGSIWILRDHPGTAKQRGAGSSQYSKVVLLFLLGHNWTGATSPPEIRWSRPPEVLHLTHCHLLL